MENGHGKNKSNKKTVLTKFRNDSEYRQKFLISVAVCWSFVVLGWQHALLGPSFLDLQYITGTDLEKGSAFVTVFWIGYMIGSIFIGAIFHRFNKSFLLFLAHVVNAVSLAAVPFCTVYEVMVVVQCIRGIGASSWDNIGTSAISFLWGVEGKTFLQVINFAFGMGGIIAPIATVPFLMDENVLRKYQEQLSSPPLNRSDSVTCINITHCSEETNYTMINSTRAPLPEKPESFVHIAYFITSALVVAVALPFLYFTLVSCREDKKDNKSKSEKTENESNSNKMPLRVYISLLVLSGIFYCFNCGCEDTFTSFLTVFSVEQLGWSKSNGSYLTVVYWCFFCFGRLAGIFLVHVFSLSRILLISVIFVCLSCIAFVIFSHFQLHVGIWIVSGCYGLSISTIFPTMISWIEENCFPVAGKVASVCLISASMGAVINPIILGYLMERLTQMWFPYLITIENTIVVVVFIVCLIAKNRIKKYRQSPLDMTTTVNLMQREEEL